MVSRRSEQQENTHFQVLRLVSENPDLSTRQIADAVGISNGAAYYCLNALVQKGLVKFGNFTASSHKGRYAYLLTPHGLKEKARLTRRFLQKKRLEYQDLRSEIERLEDELEQETPSTTSEA